MNGECDGDRDSYDVMILLTGRYDFHDMQAGTTSVILLPANEYIIGTTFKIGAPIYF